MTALVTGGGGFLGLHIVEQLVERGAAVRAFCRGEYPRLQELGVDVIRGDLRDADAVIAACRNIETVFHAAAVPGIWGPWNLFYETNTVGTRNVLEGCRRQGIGRLVYTSSPSVVFDGRPHLNADESLPYPDRYMCYYAHTKALAEREVLAASGRNNLLTTALRPHLIWGPRDNHLIPRLIRRAKSGRLRRIGDGRNWISMSYVENAAAAHLLAAEALHEGSPVCGKAYFINELDPVNLWGWIDRLLETAGLPRATSGISENTARRIGTACEALWTAFHLSGEPPMTRFLAAQLSQSHTYSVCAAERDFGYRPIVTVDAGLGKITPELRHIAETA